jgi:glycogen synthase kinase 3 beta
VDPYRNIMKLCDFGSAKCLVKGEPNVAYICSRYYRAPELVFGCEEYSTAIDVWSAGCVLGEFLIGSPIFPGNSAVDQLTQILRVLGTPSREQLKNIDPHYKTRNFQQTRPNQLDQAFRYGTPVEAIQFAGRMLEYTPSGRYIAIEVST